MLRDIVPAAGLPIPSASTARREHNLKNLSLEIPRDQFVVITGVSGSGKSTLAFDLLFNEGQRRFLDSMNVCAPVRRADGAAGRGLDHRHPAHRQH